MVPDKSYGDGVIDFRLWSGFSKETGFDDTASGVRAGPRDQRTGDRLAFQHSGQPGAAREYATVCDGSRGGRQRALHHRSGGHAADHGLEGTNAFGNGSGAAGWDDLPGIGG